MKAVLCTAWGTPDSLIIDEIEVPQVGAGQVRIRVEAAGINYADLIMIAGQYQLKPPFPFVPGMELAGQVAEVGAGVEHLQIGQRVAAFAYYGAFAEEAVVPAPAVMPIADSMDSATAATFMVAYGTSHLALAHRARLQAGETLLVHGAAGGVGLTAVELGKLMGATVIATAGSQAKLELAKSYGADHLINYREENFRDQVREITGAKGADVIFDPVGGDVFDLSMRCIAWEGRLLVIGFAGGRIPQVPANLALVKNCSIVGVYWGAYADKDPAVLQDSLATLLAWHDQGKLQPHISERYPLEEAANALNRVRNRQATGRLVLIMG